MKSPYILKSDYQIDLSPGILGIDVALGQGYDMSDPLFPLPRRRVFAATESAGSGQSPDLISSDATVMEMTNVFSEASRIAAFFSAEFGVASGSAAYQAAQSQLDERCVMYIDVSSIGAGEAIATTTWSAQPSAESIDDKSNRLTQLLADSGSHYATRVVRGKRMLIRLSKRRTARTEMQSFSVAVRAAAAFWKAEGSLSMEHQTVLTASDVDVQTTLVGGALVPEGRRIVTGWADSLALINDLKNGLVTLDDGPVRCQLQSLWHTLTKYPRTRAVLQEEEAPEQTPAPFGVPKGTVIAWSPAIENTDQDSQSKEFSVVPPVGWALCDGQHGPDLREKFIRGTVAYGDVGLSAATAHRHQVEISLSGAGTRHQGPLATGAAPPNSGYFVTGPATVPTGDFSLYLHTHHESLETGDAVALPPYYTLVYIIKL